VSFCPGLVYKGACVAIRKRRAKNKGYIRRCTGRGWVYYILGAFFFFLFFCFMFIIFCSKGFI